MSKELRDICAAYIAAQIGTVEFLSKVQLPERQRDMVRSLSKMPMPLQNLIGYDDLFDEMPKANKDQNAPRFVHDYWINLRQLMKARDSKFCYSAEQVSNKIQIWTRDNLSIVADEHDRVFATKDMGLANELALMFHCDSSQWQQADERFGLEWLLVVVTYDRLDDINMLPDVSLIEGHMSLPKQKSAPKKKTPAEQATYYFNKVARRMWPNQKVGGGDDLRRYLTIRRYDDEVPEDVEYAFIFTDPKAASAFYSMYHGESSPTKYGAHTQFGFTHTELDEQNLVPPDSACAWIKVKPKSAPKAKATLKAR